ncbi:septation protein IspZ [Patescibacteria group bacterium]|nr:septation protein IspZ [Patescibacteria group bacterium]
MPARRAILHLTTEFVPVVAFFLAGNFLSLDAATIVLITTTVAALIIGLWCAGRMPVLPVVSTIFVLISGGITLREHSPEALIIADSLYYFLLAGVVAGGLSLRFNVLKYFFDHTFAMTDEGWDVLAWRWVTIFILAGAANELVRIMLTPEAWFDFRFIKVLAITGFGLLQIKTASTYRIAHLSNHWGLRTKDE